MLKLGCTSIHQQQLNFVMLCEENSYTRKVGGMKLCLSCLSWRLQLKHFFSRAPRKGICNFPPSMWTAVYSSYPSTPSLCLLFFLLNVWLLMQNVLTVSLCVCPLYFLLIVFAHCKRSGGLFKACSLKKVLITVFCDQKNLDCFVHRMAWLFLMVRFTVFGFKWTFFHFTVDIRHPEELSLLRKPRDPKKKKKKLDETDQDDDLEVEGPLLTPGSGDLHLHFVVVFITNILFCFFFPKIP